jgi:ABC-type transport system substrate-binding protein
MKLFRLSALLAAMAIVVAACSTPPASQVPASPGASTSAAPSAAPAEQTITYVIDSDMSGGMSNAADNVPTVEAIQFMHSQLYEYNENIEIQPLMAEELAEISPDGLTWTLKLRPGMTFHDGTPITSADVVQTYELAKSPNCRYSPAACLTAFLEKVEAVDDLTVAFTLNRKLASFGTVYLPSIFIENSKLIQESYARYLDGRAAVTKPEIEALVAEVEAEIATPTGPAGADGAATVNWDGLVPKLEAMIGRAGQSLPDKTPFTVDGAVDLTQYGPALQTQVESLLTTFEASEIDALAAAYPYLDFQYNPVGLGAGPFEFVSYKSGESIEMAANPDFFLGAPQVSRMLFPIIKDDLAGGQALVAGQADWKYSLEGSTFNQIREDPNIQFVEYPEFGFYALYLNQREGQLFADKNLRQAVAYCFDKPATVEAATEGAGVPIWSEIPPASWAFPGDQVNTYPYDPELGIQLIEQSGWTRGADGIFEKDGQKLSTVAPVRAGRPDRSRYMQLLGDQVRENCGIDIRYQEVDFTALLNMLTSYPHINAAAPEQGRPFDAYFGGFVSGPDPDPYSLYHSDECSTEARPDTNNYICYSNPEVDRLIDAGLATFDQDERTGIYLDYAKIQAEDLPVIYAWSDIQREGLRTSITKADGPIALDTPYYFARIEQFTNHN